MPSVGKGGGGRWGYGVVQVNSFLSKVAWVLFWGSCSLSKCCGIFMMALDAAMESEKTHWHIVGFGACFLIAHDSIEMKWVGTLRQRLLEKRCGCLSPVQIFYWCSNVGNRTPGPKHLVCFVFPPVFCETFNILGSCSNGRCQNVNIIDPELLSVMFYTAGLKWAVWAWLAPSPFTSLFPLLLSMVECGIWILPRELQEWMM